MAGLPYIQWYAGDWSRDTHVAALSLSGRGFWFELLQAMHSSRVGRLTGTNDTFSRIARCTPDEASACITELQTTRAGEVRRHADGVTVTISSRRLTREETERNQAKNRQKAKRERERHAPVTEMSHRPYQISESKPPNPPPGGWESAAARLYDAYPRRTAREAAVKAAERAIRRVAASRAVSPGESTDWLHRRVLAYATSPLVATSERQFIPHPATWFNQGRYDDPDDAWGPKSNGHSKPPAPKAREGCS